MTREELIRTMDQQVRIVRAEYHFTQETMAQALGLSKKTLVEIEKGRSSLGWTGTAAFCSIFSDSQVLAGVLGGEASDILHALAFQGARVAYPKTMGGHVWWRPVEEYRGWRVQQNIISQHYRALNEHDERLCSSFELEVLHREIDSLNGGAQ